MHPTQMHQTLENFMELLLMVLEDRNNGVVPNI